jgi:hypothetical protein
MGNSKMLEHECIQSFSRVNGESESSDPQENGFRILDGCTTEQNPNSHRHQSTRADTIPRRFDPQQLHSRGCAISIDQEEEIWADLERRIREARS